MRFFEKLMGKMFKFGSKMTVNFIKSIFAVGLLFGFGALSTVGYFFSGNTVLLIAGLSMIASHFVFKGFNISRSLLSFLALILSVVTYFSTKLIMLYHLSAVLFDINYFSYYAIFFFFIVFVTSKDLKSTFAKALTKTKEIFKKKKEKKAAGVVSSSSDSKSVKGIYL